METNNQDQVKDLQGAKDLLAKQRGFKSWYAMASEYQECHIEEMENKAAEILIQQALRKQIPIMLEPGSAPVFTHSAKYIEQYKQWLSGYVQQAKDAAFKEGCEAQKIVCALYAMLDTSDFVDDRLKTMSFEIEGGGEGIISIDEDSILKAPNAKSPYTTGEKGGEDT